MSIKATRREGEVSLEGYYLNAIEEPDMPVDFLRKSILRAAEEVLEGLIEQNEITHQLSVTGFNAHWNKPEQLHIETQVWIADDPLLFSADLRDMFDELFTKQEDYEDQYDEILSFAKWLNQRLEEKGLTPKE